MEKVSLPNLKLEDVILNLKMISKIKQNDKMIVVNKVINVDYRYIPFIQRWITSDSRNDTIYFIELVVDKAIEYIDIHDEESSTIFDKSNIIKCLLSCIQGIDNLSVTYKLDNLLVSKTDMLKEKIQKKCK